MTTFRSSALVFALGLTLVACSADHKETRTNLVVFAAASLKEPLNEIARALESHDSTIHVTLSFGASNILARQIASGAPADLFASASETEMDNLAAAKAIDTSTRAVFARNSLVVVAPASSAAIDSLGGLRAASYRRIAIAAKGVPARVYTEESLRRVGLWDGLEPRFVFGDNVRQVVDYVVNGNADAAFVYASDAIQFADRVTTIYHVEDGLHRPINYPIAIVQSSPNRKAAESFRALVLSARGRVVFQQHGFVVR
jgi:molybdate transport system substrate-binding protein